MFNDLGNMIRARVVSLPASGGRIDVEEARVAAFS